MADPPAVERLQCDSQHANQPGLVDPDYSASGVYSPNGASSVKQWEWIPASPAQQWQIYPQVNGTVEIQNVYTGKFLDDPNSSTSNLTGMIDYPYNGGTNQQWTMLAAGSGPSIPFSLQNASSGTFVASDLLAIPLADGNDLIVDANAGGGGVLGGFDNVVSEGGRLTGGLYQQWYIAPQGNGYVGIVNASSYLVMDQTGPGAISLDEWYQGLSQEWAFAQPRPTDLMVTRERSSEGPGLQRSGPTYLMSDGVRCPMGCPMRKNRCHN